MHAAEVAEVVSHLSDKMRRKNSQSVEDTIAGKLQAQRIVIVFFAELGHFLVGLANCYTYSYIYLNRLQGK